VPPTAAPPAPRSSISVRHTSPWRPPLARLRWAARSLGFLLFIDGLGPAVSGLIVGSLAAVLIRMGMRPMFVRLVPAIDPVALGVVPLAMLAAALVACYLPARRAARVDPNVALRDL
jgi:ABC-type antimicrobial peptide transport system permease subunit